MGLAIQRVPEDDVVAVPVHFTKDNGEQSGITLGDQSQIEAIGKQTDDAIAQRRPRPTSGGIP